MIRVLLLPGLAGEGEVARYMSRFASSSPFWLFRGVAVKVSFRRRPERDMPGGGVRGLCRGGGEERRCEALSWKEDTGRSASSSSESSGERGSSATVEPSETNDRLGTWGSEKFLLLRYAGDDSGSL